MDLNKIKTIIKKLNRDFTNKNIDKAIFNLVNNKLNVEVLEEEFSLGFSKFKKYIILNNQIFFEMVYQRNSDKTTSLLYIQ